MAILNDTTIEAMAARGALISQHFIRDNLKQACYELRASNKYFTISNGVSTRRQAAEYLLLPNDYLVVVTKEKLLLPDDVLGRILSKGHLFSLGVIPVNTYADPGFEGFLGITLFNSSSNIIRIADGQAIAKIEFDRLEEAVAKPYRGQHGLSLDVWPVPAHLLVQSSELPRFGISGSYQINKIYHGKTVADLIVALNFYTRWIWIQIAVTMAVLVTVVYLHGEVSLAGSLFLGVAANVLTQVFGIVARRCGLFEQL